MNDPTLPVIGFVAAVCAVLYMFSRPHTTGGTVTGGGCGCITLAIIAALWLIAAQAAGVLKP